MPTATDLRRLRRHRQRAAAARRSPSARQGRDTHAARRLAAFAVLASLLVVTLLLTAFSPAPATRAVDVAAASPSGRLLPVGPPKPQTVAARGALRLQLPIAQDRVTALGYHDPGGGALALQPVGRQGNPGLLRRLFEKVAGHSSAGPVWYALDGGRTAALDVGAPSGTDVFAPVDGVVVGISQVVLDGRRHGVRVDLQPISAPSLVVSVTRLRPDPTLTVGSTVVASLSRLGSVLGLARVEKQELARFTQDAGNHVTVDVRPAPTLPLG